MTHIIFFIIACTAFGVLFAELSGIPQFVSRFLAAMRIWYKQGYYINGEFVSDKSGKALPRRIKPFDCGMCLSFWTCFLISKFWLHADWIYSVGFAAMSAVLAVIILKYLNSR